MSEPWVLVLCHEFPPLGGGAGKNLFLLCRELTKQGLKVKVWTSDPGVVKRLKFDFDVDYIEVRRKARFETTFRGMLNYILEVMRRSYGTKYFAPKPSFVLSVLGIPAGLGGNFLAKRINVPHVVWYHGSDIHAGKPEGPGKLQRFLLRNLWKNVQVHFFVAKGLQAQAETLGLKVDKSRSLILPACPSPEILAYPPSDRISNRYFLFLGRLDEVKNPLLLLKAISILKSEGVLTCKFRLVGSGKLQDEIKKFMRVHALTEWVSLEKAVAFEKVPELLQDAYALILPSRMEGFNTTLLEAAHFSVPSIAADTLGVRDFVLHNETGLLFAENDPKALVAALKKLEGDSNLRDTLGKNAKKAAAPYTPENVAEIFVTAVTHLLPREGVFKKAP